MANEGAKAAALRASDYVAPEGQAQGYFKPHKQYSKGTYGDYREPTAAIELPANLPAHDRTPPSSLTGENVSNVTPNDSGGWTADVTMPDGTVAEGLEVDSGFGSMIGDNVGFKLTTGEITLEDIRLPDSFNNEAPLNEGQMGIVDQWREQMGPDGSIKAYEPATNMLVELRPDQLAGAMDAGYRFDPSTISNQYVGGIEMPNSPQRDFTPEETANQTVNDPFAHLRGNEDMLPPGMTIPPAPQSIQADQLRGQQGPPPGPPPPIPPMGGPPAGGPPPGPPPGPPAGGPPPPMGGPPPGPPMGGPPPQAPPPQAPPPMAPPPQAPPPQVDQEEMAMQQRVAEALRGRGRGPRGGRGGGPSGGRRALMSR